MDLARASDELDRLIEKRAGERDAANFEEVAWKASVRRHHAKLRQQHRAEWFCYWSALADSLKASAEVYEAKAEALLEEGNHRDKGDDAA